MLDRPDYLDRSLVPSPHQQLQAVAARMQRALDAAAAEAEIARTETLAA
ncbi:hypothetical protein [Rhodococcoides fascians]|nr:hypothetical protein [Rhodococcus fascians]